MKGERMVIDKAWKRHEGDGRVHAVASSPNPRPKPSGVNTHGVERRDKSRAYTGSEQSIVM